MMKVWQMKLCSAGWCWWLVLIFCERKILLVDWCGNWCWFCVREKYYWLDAAKMKRTESEEMNWYWHEMLGSLQRSRCGNEGKQAKARYFLVF